MKITTLFTFPAVLLFLAAAAVGQTQLEFQNGFNTMDSGGIAYLRNSGNLAIIDQQGGGGGGPTRLDIYTTDGVFLQTITLSTAGLAAGDEYLDNGLADLPNGNLIVLTLLGNVHEINPSTGMIVSGGYGGFNVLAGMPTGAETSGFAHNPDTDNLWVIDDNGQPFDTLTEFDNSGNVVLPTPFPALPMNLNGDAEAVSFVPDLQTMFVAEDDTNTLIEITPAGAHVQTLFVADLSQGSGLFVDPDGLATDFEGGRIFVSNKTPDAGNVMVFSTTTTSCDFSLGDVNQDGVVDFLDIQPFVDVLNAMGFQCEADVNEDGVVDFLDIQPFVDLLS